MNIFPPLIGEEQQHGEYVVSSRKVVAAGTDVQVKEFTLKVGEEIPWHRHTAVFDVFYCLEGRLLVDHADPAGAGISGTLALNVGQSAKVEAGTAHRPHNDGPGACRFLLVQGVGRYDYIPAVPVQDGKAE